MQKYNKIIQFILKLTIVVFGSIFELYIYIAYISAIKIKLYFKAISYIMCSIKYRPNFYMH